MKPISAHKRQLRRPRYGLVVAAALGTAVIGASGTVATAGTTRPTLPTPSITTSPISGSFNASVTTSPNFSGYLYPGTLHMRNMHAEWTVSKLSTKYNGWSYQWLGTGGSTTGASVLQLGTAEVVTNHRPSYSVWWWKTGPGIKSQPVHFSHMKVRPGERVYVSMKQTSPHHWSLLVKDLRTHKKLFVKTWWYTNGLGAMFTVENPPQSGDFPDFHTITFSHCYYNGNHRLSRSAKHDVATSSGKLLDRTSDPKSHSRGFSVTWLRP